MGVSIGMGPNEKVRVDSTHSTQEDIDAFHAHLDACARCANQPFNLCPTGAKLIEQAVNGKRD